MTTTNGATNVPANADTGSAAAGDAIPPAHPHLDFCHSLASDAQALCDFLGGRNPAPTQEIHDALVHGDFDALKTELLKENPNLIEVSVPIEDLRLNDGSTNAGWVLKTLTAQLSGQWASLSTPTSPTNP